MHARALAGSSRARRGFALLTVLMVLLALLVLCAPFLMTARNTSKAGAQLADRAQARLALDSALRHARARLEQSHIAFDSTPYADDESELYELDPLDPEFLDARNEHGVMFSAEVEDIAAALDINSAPPQLFANLLGLVTRTVEPIKAEDTELIVSSTFGFPPVGFLWIDDELIGYSELEPQKFKKLVRGIGGRLAEDKTAIPCGPQPPKPHVLGSVVIEQRAFAPVLWRTQTPGGVLRMFDAPEQVRDCSQLALGLEAQADLVAQERHAADPRSDLAQLRSEERERAALEFVEPFVRLGSVHASVRAGREWQRPVRVLTPVEGGKTCRVEVEQTRWFSPGTTVRISDGQTTELAIVQAVDAAAVYLNAALANDYFVGHAQLESLARRPVNANTASVEVLELLFANLAIRNVNDRITRDEARALAELVVESRPFEGFEDFVKRIVLPAAGLAALPKDARIVPDIFAQGGTLIDTWDAVALHANALNSNDSLLAYSTLPLCFTSRDVFKLTARASVNAPSGVERVSALREQVELVVPQRDLMQLWARQEDFDEAARLDGEAPWWSTGPSATARRDGWFPRVNLGPGLQGTATPPSPLLAHLGVHAQMLFGGGAAAASSSGASSAQLDPTATPFGDPVMASREDNGWAALWPSRVSDTATPGTRHVMHLDHESRDPEGRYLPDQPIVKNVTGTDVQWSDPTGQPPMLGAFGFSMWFKPRELTPNQTLLDIGRTSLETDRVQLFFDGVDLVLRVFDGAGDHSGTAGFTEAGEVRYAIATGGTDPGIPADTWMHVALDVRGNRPSQMSMLIDGRTLGVRTPGLTRLAAQLADSAAVITVESTEGFGATGSPVVLRIGNELIEAVVTGAQTFDATRGASFPQFGGRMARVPFDLANSPNELGVAEGGILQATRTNHASGTPVELYGFAAMVLSNVPAGGGSLRSQLGVWTVGRMTEVVGGQTPQGDPLEVQGTFFNIPLGTGLDGQSNATGIVIQPVDTGVSAAQLAAAFNPTGGYAALIQKGEDRRINVSGPNPQTISTLVTPAGTPLFGVEIIRYGSAAAAGAGVTLTIAQRAALRALDQNAIARAFVAVWQPNHTVGQPATPLADLLDWQTFVVPISIPDSGGGGVTGFPVPLPDESEFVQLGGANSQIDNTEWVRYDQLSLGHLVRSNRLALERLRDVLTLRLVVEDIDTTQPPNPPIVGPPDAPFDPSGVPGGVSGGAPIVRALAAAPNAPPPSAAPAQSQGGGVYWQSIWGAAEDLNWPVTLAARTAFQFRGVFGTHTHVHPVGTPLLPVWRTPDAGMNSQNVNGMIIPEYTNGRSINLGLPGRLDSVFLMEAATGSAGWPLRVHRSHRPFQYSVYGWQRAGGTVLTGVSNNARVAFFEDAWMYAKTSTFVALDTPAPAPIAFGTGNAVTTAQNPILDSRQFSRVLKHPCGERPREVDRVFVGSNVRGAEVASSVVDELVFSATNFGGSVGRAQQAGQLLLIQDLATGPQSVNVAANILLLANGEHGTGSVNPLSALPARPGLARVGDEIVCYESVDASTSSFNISAGGRGLLGTIETSHEVGATLTLLDSLVVSTLVANVSADDSTLPLRSTDGFPPQGTVLIDGELIHYTRIIGGALEMPRRSSEPGKRDAKAGGIFRGRFGTDPAGHNTSAPVILFPFRYWDRWSDRADAPEMGYFGLCVDQPSAFFKSAFFIQEEPSAGSARIEVLQRLVRRGRPVPPWDGDPLTTPGLSRLTLGAEREQGSPINDQADLIEWRAHVRYIPGAFDAINGLSHGWKQTPRLRVFGVEYLAPSAVLRRVGE